jgi:hypothetical protein
MFEIKEVEKVQATGIGYMIAQGAVCIATWVFNGALIAFVVT